MNITLIIQDQQFKKHGSTQNLSGAQSTWTSWTILEGIFLSKIFNLNEFVRVCSNSWSRLLPHFHIYFYLYLIDSLLSFSHHSVLSLLSRIICFLRQAEIKTFLLNLTNPLTVNHSLMKIPPSIFNRKISPTRNRKSWPNQLKPYEIYYFI